MIEGSVHPEDRAVESLERIARRGVPRRKRGTTRDTEHDRGDNRPRERESTHWGKDHPRGPVAHPKNRNTRNSDASALDAGRGLAERRRGVKGRIEHAPVPRSYGREGCLALADERSMTTARMFKLKPCGTKRVHR